MKLERYEWQNIKAALIFYAHACEYSAVSPLTHHRVSQALDGCLPLNPEQIMELANTSYERIVGKEI